MSKLPAVEDQSKLIYGARMAKRLLRLGRSVSFMALLAASSVVSTTPPDPDSVLNTADKYPDIVVSGGGLTATLTTTQPSGNYNIRGTSYGPTSTGKYFEVTFNNLVTGQAHQAGFGIASKTQSLTIRPGDQVGAYATHTMPTDKFGMTYCPETGYAKWPGSSAATWATGAASDTYGVLVTGTGVVFYKNGNVLGTATALPAQRLYPIISLANNSDSVTVNFGATAFAYLPAGAVAWSGTPPHTPFTAVLQHPEKIGAVICQEVVNTYYFGNTPLFGDWFENPPTSKQAVLDGINDIGFHHYQTQVHGPIAGNQRNLKFYPAFNDPGEQTTATLAAAQLAAQLSGSNIILGYNEPWNFGGATTPQIALDGWPALMALGTRLASPSISGPTDGTAWLDQFMAGVSSRGYRVDLINVHYYANLAAGASVETFRQYLIDIHNRYGKPIIITEWACDEWSDNGISTDLREYSAAYRNPTFTLQQQADYVRDALVMLDSLDFVEFHTYWEAVDGNGWYYNTPLLWSDGTPTIIGQVFKEAISRASSVVAPPTTSNPTILNTADKAPEIALSSGSLKATLTTSSPGNKNVRATKPGAAGRYFEAHIDSAVSTGSTMGIGVANLSQGQSYPGNPNGVGWFASGYAEWPGSGFNRNFGTYGANVTIGVYVKASSVEFYKNGSLVGTATGLPSGDLYPIFSPANNGDSATFNFGATPFQNLPTGATAWDTTQGSTYKLPVTWSPTDHSAGVALSNGDLTASYIDGQVSGIGRATLAGGEGDYFEITATGNGNGTTLAVGVSNASQSLTPSNGKFGDPNGITYFNDGYIEWPGGSNFSSGYAPAWGPGDKIGVLPTATTLKYFKNGTLAYEVPTLPSGELFPTIGTYSSTLSGTANFGATPFQNLPAGAQAWDTNSPIVEQPTGYRLPVTWNSTDQNGLVLSGGNLTSTYAGSGGGIGRATLAGGAGDYFEVTAAGGSGSTIAVGVSNSSQALTGVFGNPNGVTYFTNGYIEWPGGSNFDAALAWGPGDTIGVLPTATTLKYFKNGTLAYEAPALPTGNLFPTIGNYDTNGSAVADFGATTFRNLPAGAVAWDTNSPIVPFSSAPRYVCDGDSLTYGYLSSNPYPAQLMALSGLAVVNLGISGKKLVDMDATYTSYTAPNYVPGAINYLIVEGGINDIYNGGTASGLATAIRSYCAKAKATGFKVYITTLTPSSGYGFTSPSNLETIRQTVNTDRRNNWPSFADGLIDLDAALPNSADQKYYNSDGLHYNAEGDAVIAVLVWAATTTLANPNKVGCGAWGEWIENGQPVTGDPNDTMPSQVALDGLNAIGFKFYQTWHPQPLTGNQGNVNFIPGWWNSGDGDGELTPSNLALMQADGDLIIGSNEPWNNFGQPQFGLSPAQALSVWPKLLALGNRLATPSISGGDGWGWLQEFMAGAAANNYRVDIINVHYYMQYPNQDINAFRNYLQMVHDTYGRPIIVTEWGLYVNWGWIGDINTPQVPFGAQAAWAVAGTKMMDSLDFIEQHYWYAESTGAGGTMYLGTECIHNDGTLSPIGYAYRQLLRHI
jgi:lysophospholipase L1-like esterase